MEALSLARVSLRHTATWSRPALLRSNAGHRAYSFFSSKPGSGNDGSSGGKYFNSNKGSKSPTTASTTPNAVANGSNGAASAVNGSANGASVSSPKPGNKPEINEDTPASPLNPLASLTPESESSTPSLETPSSSLVEPTLTLQHPHPVFETVHLHKFFAVDRPLLLLPHSQPSSIIFSKAQPDALERLGQTDKDASPSPDTAAEESGLMNGEFGMGMEDPDADADAARLLSRSLVMQNIASRVEWDAVMKRLGFENASGVAEMETLKVAATVQMDSVKRKRRKKITKHKYKKRRKLQRAERRRLGK